jgi:pyruvate formate-lyase activating enzyme-like uncharacterized protein
MAKTLKEILVAVRNAGIDEIRFKTKDSEEYLNIKESIKKDKFILIKGDDKK